MSSVVLALFQVTPYEGFGMNARVVISWVLLVVAMVGCVKKEELTGPPNVLLVSVDTLRKDHLGCYGYSRLTSPHIDQLASEGVVFDNVISTSPWTLPSHASMLTGRYPAFHGLQDDGVKLAPHIPTLAESFKRQRYYTVAVVSHVYVSSAFGLEKGFDVFDDSLIAEGTKNPIASQIVDRFLTLADIMPTKQYFGFIHFFDPHWDYLPPPPFNARFTDPDYKGDIDGTLKSLEKYFPRWEHMPDADWRQMIAYYDGEIAYVDSQINRLLKALEKRGMLDNTVVVIISDHGEEFKDHGRLGHGKTLFGEQLRVPLIISGHLKAPPGSRRKDLVSICDLAPTLLDLIGAHDLPHSHGRSILADGEDRKRLVIAESIRFGLEMRAVHNGRFKLIHYLEGDKSYFYDLKSDPLELNPLQEDPTGGILSTAIADYTEMADSGWHMKFIALNSNNLHCKATIKTSGHFVNPRHYFSKKVTKARVDVMSFELSPDKKTLAFDVIIARHVGEVVFKTDSPEATVTFKVKTACSEKESGVFLGSGVRVPDDEEITLKHSDPRVEGVPPRYLKAETGVYIRTVKAVADSAPKARLSEGALDQLRSLGYVE